MQNEYPTQIGYTPKEDAPFCQRCFRIKHYNKLNIDMKDEILPEHILTKINDMDVLVVWVCDLFDLEGSFKLSINRWLKNKDILLVGTKRDLLPKTLGNDKLVQFIYDRLKANDLWIKGLCVTADFGKDGAQSVLKAVDQLREGRDVVIMGNANSGKSTLINAMTNLQLTTSYFPGTTLDFYPIKMDDYTLFDTPGLLNNGSALQYIDSSDLEQIIVRPGIKVRTFQLYEDQSYAIGGLVRIDLIGVQQASVSFYVADSLPIHRGHHSSAQQLWDKHYGTLLLPVIGEYQQLAKRQFPVKYDRVDVCINGIGFVCIRGEVKAIEVQANQQVDVTLRKGMI
jgi:30S ribosome assembly GTPase